MGVISMTDPQVLLGSFKEFSETVRHFKTKFFLGVEENRFIPSL